jgi:hypothetical protein
VLFSSHDFLLKISPLYKFNFSPKINIITAVDIWKFIYKSWFDFQGHEERPEIKIKSLKEFNFYL